MTKHSEAPEWTYEETKEKILSTPNKHFRAFITISYIAGLRISEAIAFRAIDTYETKSENGTDYFIMRLPNRKNPHRTIKEIPINKITEKEYYEIIKTFIQGDQKVFPFYDYSKRTYQRKIKYYLDIHPHALRHLRVHHIDDQTIPGMKGLTPRQYKDYFGWHKIGTSSHYQSRTKTLDLMNQF